MNRPSVAFVCVQNAGRSQMATAFAKRENQRRNMNVRILTGGTEPADRVHPEVVEVMNERGIDLSDNIPRRIKPEELHSCNLVITMGCEAEDVCPANYYGENRDWDLDDPHGKDLESVRSIRDDIKRRISILFDQLDGDS
jgi:protein-tyrosine-phosphatase